MTKDVDSILEKARRFVVSLGCAGNSGVRGEGRASKGRGSTARTTQDTHRNGLGAHQGGGSAGLRHNPVDVELSQPDPVSAIQGNPSQRTYLALWCGMPVHLHVLTFVKRPNPIAPLPGPKSPHRTVAAALDAPPPVQANMMTQPDMIAIATEVEGALVQLIAAPAQQVLPVLACAKVTCRAHLGSPGDEHVTQRITSEVHVVTPLLPGAVSLSQWLKQRWPQCDLGGAAEQEGGGGAGDAGGGGGEGGGAGGAGAGAATSRQQQQGQQKKGGAESRGGAASGKERSSPPSPPPPAQQRQAAATGAAAAAAALPAASNANGTTASAGRASQPPPLPQPRSVQKAIAAGTLPPVAEGTASSGKSAGGGPVAEGVNRSEVAQPSGDEDGSGSGKGAAVGPLACMACFAAGSAPSPLPPKTPAGGSAADGHQGAAEVAAPAAVSGDGPAATQRVKAPPASGAGPGAGRGLAPPQQERLPPPPPAPTQPQLPVVEALELLIGVAEGLRNLHRRGLTHGSLTPQTIQLHLLMQPSVAAAAAEEQQSKLRGEQRTAQEPTNEEKQQPEEKLGKVQGDGKCQREEPPQNIIPGNRNNPTPEAPTPPVPVHLPNGHGNSAVTRSAEAAEPGADEREDASPPGVAATGPSTSSSVSPFSASCSAASPDADVRRVSPAASGSPAAATATSPPPSARQQRRYALPPLPPPPQSGVAASGRSFRQQPPSNQVAAAASNSTSPPAAAADSNTSPADNCSNNDTTNNNNTSPAAADGAASPTSSPPAAAAAASSGGAAGSNRNPRPVLPLPAIGPALLQLQTWGRARPMGLPRDHLLWCAPELLNPNGNTAGWGQQLLLARRSFGNGGGSTGTLGLGPLDRSLGCRGSMAAAAAAATARASRGGGGGSGSGSGSGHHSSRLFGDGSYGGLTYGGSMGGSMGSNMGGSRRVRYGVSAQEPSGAGSSSPGGIAPSCDVYSLGMLMWHLVSGQLPFDHLVTLEVLRVKELGQLDEQLPFSSGLPPPYTRLARRCWSLLPLQRPSIRMVLAELRALRAELTGVPLVRGLRGPGSSFGDLTCDSRLSFTLSAALSSRELGLDDYSLTARPPLELAFGVTRNTNARGDGDSGEAGSAGGAAGAPAKPPSRPPPLTASLPPGLLSALTAPRAPTSRRGSGGGGGGSLLDDEEFSDRFTDTNEHTEASASGTPQSSPVTRDGTTGRGNSVAGRIMAAMAAAAASATNTRRIGCAGGSAGGRNARAAGDGAYESLLSDAAARHGSGAGPSDWGTGDGDVSGGGGGGGGGNNRFFSMVNGSSTAGKGGGLRGRGSSGKGGAGNGSGGKGGASSSGGKGGSGGGGGGGGGGGTTGQRHSGQTERPALSRLGSTQGSVVAAGSSGCGLGLGAGGGSSKNLMGATIGVTGVEVPCGVGCSGGGGGSGGV